MQAYYQKNNQESQRLLEISEKIQSMRALLSQAHLGGFRLRGADWFAWATAGGSNSLLFNSETGVAEVLVTPQKAMILTTPIEAERLQQEEILNPYEIWAFPWPHTQKNKAKIRELIKDLTPSGLVASDRFWVESGEDSGPSQEVPLPVELVSQKRILMPSEIQRYQLLGQDIAQAMTHILTHAKPDWTEFDLAAEAAKALWHRGIEPLLILTGGNERLEKYRNPLPSHCKLGNRAMLILCGRRMGLYANLTRIVYFVKPTLHQDRLLREVAQVESAAFKQTVPGEKLSQVLQAISNEYKLLGYPGQEEKHHQGGITGYLSREIIATPETHEVLQESMAVAWNPSLPGVKMEDTMLIQSRNPSLSLLTPLTLDPDWPTFTFQDRERPNYWIQP